MFMLPSWSSLIFSRALLILVFANTVLCIVMSHERLPARFFCLTFPKIVRAGSVVILVIFARSAHNVVRERMFL